MKVAELLERRREQWRNLEDACRELERRPAAIAGRSRRRALRQLVSGRLRRSGPGRRLSASARHGAIPASAGRPRAQSTLSQPDVSLARVGPRNVSRAAAPLAARSGPVAGLRGFLGRLRDWPCCWRIRRANSPSRGRRSHDGAACRKCIRRADFWPQSPTPAESWPASTSSTMPASACNASPADCCWASAGCSSRSPTRCNSAPCSASCSPCPSGRISWSSSRRTGPSS